MRDPGVGSATGRLDDAAASGAGGPRQAAANSDQEWGLWFASAVTSGWSLEGRQAAGDEELPEAGEEERMASAAEGCGVDPAGLGAR